MNFTANELARLMLDNAKGKVQLPANFSEGEVKTPDEAISDAFFQVILGKLRKTEVIVDVLLIQI